MVVVGKRHLPAPLPPGKEPVLIVEEAGWAQEPVWTAAENLARTQFDPWTVQPAASWYKDWDISAHKI